MAMTEAIFLGVLQGLTEFLPISSTGHLVLAHTFFGTAGTTDLAFDAILHLATACAVIVYFRRDIILLLNTVARMLARLPVNTPDAMLLNALIVGTIPAVILGLSLESLMETLFRNPLLVAGVLVAGSFLFMYAEWVYMHRSRDNKINARKGLIIGLFQSLALIPGVSRSGASIVGGMLLGLTRAEAARFAFLLAVPVILGAGGKKLVELMLSDGVVEWNVVIAGAAVAFFVGLLAIHFMLGFVRRYTLWPFIWYRIILAVFVVLFVYLGGG